MLRNALNFKLIYNASSRCETARLVGFPSELDIKSTEFDLKLLSHLYRAFLGLTISSYVGLGGSNPTPTHRGAGTDGPPASWAGLIRHCLVVWAQSRACSGFLLRGQDWRAEGRERDEVLEEGQQLSSQPATGSGERCEPPAGFGAKHSALRMASPDTIILLIVDYHAVIGGKTPSCPLAYALSSVCGTHA